MPLNALLQQGIEDFFKAIAPQESAYVDANFSYVALREGDSFVIIQARLMLNNGQATGPFAHFRSENVRAGNFKLAELNLTTRQTIEALASGALKTPHGDLSFPPGDNGTHGVNFQPFHPENLQQQTRVSVLSFLGARHAPLTQNLYLDWELKASPTPYDSLRDLMSEYLLGVLRHDHINIEVIAPNVAAVDLNLKLSGTKAQIGIVLSKFGTRSEVTLGYRVFSQGKTVTRSSLQPDQLSWNDDGDFLRGQAEIEIPQAAIVQCIATYAGNAQQQAWMTDQEALQNPLRAVYETFDLKLITLVDVLAKEGRARGRDLEAGISWLLWMLGFRPAHLGERIQDGPDLLVTTPSGHFALVECTAGLLKAENKLSLLHDRTLAVRRSLQKSNSQHLRVLPVIVTTKTREEINPDIEQAERWGILVLTRENLEVLVERTLALPNPDRLYEEIEQEVRSAQTKYELQGKLPIPEML